MPLEVGKSHVPRDLLSQTFDLVIISLSFGGLEEDIYLFSKEERASGAALGEELKRQEARR